ncbi:hypothetical protein V8B97DRAFT_1923817 [Scleroderma yunnanense]
MPTTRRKDCAPTYKSLKVPFSGFLAVSFGLSLFTIAYKRALDPLFGGTPTEKHLNHVINACTILGFFLPKLTTCQTLLVLGTLVQFAPNTTYWVGIHAGRYGDPTIGLLITHVLVLAPVALLSVSLTTRITSPLAMVVFAAIAPHLRLIAEAIVHKLSLDTRKDYIFLFLGVLLYTAWTWVKINAVKPTSGMHRDFRVANLMEQYFPLVILAIFLLFPSMWSPSLSASQIFPYHSTAYPLRILSSQESLTGTVVVGELLDAPKGSAPDALHSLRYLRVSHSLLGGVWIADMVDTIGNVAPQIDEYGTPLGDSIYSTFVLQEAVRLINSTSRCQDSSCGNALVIGVGTGIVADAFARHGVTTTLIEIDPAVYDAARRFFGLRHPGDDKVFLEDARGWLHERVSAQSVSSSNTRKFDMVVHDCFSGGGVPKELFSLEFWNELKKIMTPTGVIAINFAGKLGSRSSRAVTTTLLKAFGQCRAFHDILDPSTVQNFHAEFMNMVFFCSISQTPLTFRPPVEHDYLHSHLRHFVLSSLEKREVPIAAIRNARARTKEVEEIILTDTNNKLDEWQRDDALEHWKIMRKVLPDIVWETY